MPHAARSLYQLRSARSMNSACAPLEDDSTGQPSVGTLQQSLLEPASPIHRAQEGERANEAGNLDTTSDFGDLTPPGSPNGVLHKHPSVDALYASARRSFDGRLQPRAGHLEAVDHPLPRPSISVVPQHWDAKLGMIRETSAGCPASTVTQHTGSKVQPLIKGDALRHCCIRV